MRKKDATAPTTEPILSGSPSLRCINVKLAMAPKRITRPTTAAAISPTLPLPVVARSTRAAIGKASFKNVFHTKVTKTDRPTAESANPHDRNTP